jgi:RNA polymerase sigma factor for flagellar operon FliA
MAGDARKNAYRKSASPPEDQTHWEGLSPAERQDYIDKYAPLIKYVAERLASRLPPHIAREDLISAGILGLIDAVDKFDSNRKILFKTYAEFRIKGAMLDELRALDWVPRSVRKKSSQLEKAYQKLESDLGRPATDEEAAESLDLTLDDYHRLLHEVKGVSIVDVEALRSGPQGQNRGDFFEMVADEGAFNALDALGLREVRDVIAEAIENLPEKERYVVTFYYYEELTMKEIGQVLNYTESRISQLHTKAILRLKGRLRRYFEEKQG